MTLTVPRVPLGQGATIPRLIRGGWQLAGGHGPVDRERAIADIAAFVAAGMDTVDGADIYTGVEELYGAFNQRRRAAGQPPLRVHTKFVPDASDLARVDAAYVRRIVTRSLQRLQAPSLDLVQFHWWDYAVPGAVETALHLAELQREGLIAQVGGTNFDTAHTRQMLDAGVPLVSMQTQYSLLDRRSAGGLAALAASHGVQLLCYGTLAGGFLTDRWLGKPPPPADPGNRSLVKYRLIIDEFGGWDAFQALLRVLQGIAQRQGVALSAVAIRWVLDRPGVAAAIVGARYADALPATLQALQVQLLPQDHAAIDALLAATPGPQGEPYALERDRNGPHGRIMKYDLNKA
ncbi:MAG: aldo/keto reductase [Rubrivivax sp.]|nr:aldo/keto reductase [Rubrivivax sp.]